MSCIDDIREIIEELKVCFMKVLKEIEEVESDKIYDANLVVTSGSNDEVMSTSMNICRNDANHDFLLKVFEGMVIELESWC